MIVLTGGGTGGHLSVVKSLKEELNKRGIKPVFIGSTYGQDRYWFENDNGFEEKYFFNTEGVVNKGKIGKLFSLVKILSYTLKCRLIFKKYNIEKVVSVGGYSAAPASLASIIYKKEFYIHEQNAKMGTLNKKLSPFAKTIFSSYLTNSPVKDYPVREDFFKKARIRKEVKTVIFLGGSQGANFVNELAMKISPILLQKGINVIHQCGKSSYDHIKEFYKERSVDIKLYDFIDDMPSMLHQADIAISRSGASTLWELCANSLPAIFIPYPYATYDHQYYNAKFIQDKKAGYVMRQDEIKIENILDIVINADVESLSKNLQSIIQPKGAEKIIDFIFAP